MNRKKFRLVGAGALAAAGLLTNMLPAAAAGAGDTPGGHSTITASGPIANPLCIKSGTNNAITLYNYGTLQTGTGVPYVGPFTATFTFGQIYFGPEGVYTNSTCTVPSLVNASANIVSGWVPTPVALQPTPPSSGGTIGSCGGPATYSRVTNAYVLKASGPCTVNGVPGLLPSNFVFSGNQTPCLFGLTGVDNCGGVLDDTEFVGTYTQAP